MELNEYRKRKKKKGVHIQKIGDNYFIVAKTYDPWTGEVAKELTEPITKDALLQRKKELENLIKDLDEVIKDIDHA